LAVASVLLLFVIAVSLHSRLYESRPDARHLTLFYLVMSIGGALGGAFTAIVAPVLFDWVWEHPMLVFAAALVMPLPELLKWRRLDGLDPRMAQLAGGVMLALVAFLAWLLVSLTADGEQGAPQVFVTMMLCGLGIMVMSWRWMFAAVLLLTMLGQGGLETLNKSIEQSRIRSYFGIYTVRDYQSAKLRTLAHGTTLHGQQSLDPARTCEPMTYYGPNSGVGIALREASSMYGGNARIGVVGLGTGTLASYRKRGQQWTFFEIDPAVLELSRDGTFTYLRDCAPDAKVALGDARLELEKVPPHSLDVLAIDAFSSDAIPLHLITDEAMGVYMRALSEDGLLVIHISNRFIDLEPVMAAAAKRRGLALAMRIDNPPNRTDLTPSAWVALARDGDRLKALAKAHPDLAWEPLEHPAPNAWTDDFASILPYIRWDKLLGKP
ncbi:MAG: fused MFS/spermidine synthase, partial [Novosphingobium sp.]|nr:fused MFS/spermidine synthase [Novosphingobium sp.]